MKYANGMGSSQNSAEETITATTVTRKSAFFESHDWMTATGGMLQFWQRIRFIAKDKARVL